MTKHAHLTLEERIAIGVGLTQAQSRAVIARSVGKDRSTIAKEIKKYRRQVLPKVRCTQGIRPVFDCSHMEECGCRNVCQMPCKRYEMRPCLRRDKKVGVCNGCERSKSCKQVQYLYDPAQAHDAYKAELSDSRQGVNLTLSQAKAMGKSSNR